MTRRAHICRVAGVGLLVWVLALVTGCALQASGPALRLPPDKSESTPHKGDTSPRRVAQPMSSAPASVKPKKRKSAAPTVTMSPLPQPEETFATPRMPKAPAKSDTELTRIAYQLKTEVWKSAGVVDPKTTKADCTVSENDIIQVGTYNFSCDVSLWGSSTRFGVRAKVSRSEVQASWTAKRLPVSEQKAIYEATRQSFKPARVTCDIIGLELVEVGNRNAFTCWVTDVYNEAVTYRGELLPTGALALRPES
ncbi:hypothetical protein [Actinopolymorpha sp. B9G3]|uniref:hypothetical protein n=1 Tax=Actinopolymorpha sp. B9G3 TaxID=3158970 RepID=UPI0032D92738